MVDAKETPTDLTRRRNVTTSVDVSEASLSSPHFNLQLIIYAMIRQ